MKEARFCGKIGVILPEIICIGRMARAEHAAFREQAMKDEASYICDSCGEEIVVPIDLSAGSEQEYVVHVEVDEDGEVRVWASRE